MEFFCLAEFKTEFERLKRKKSYKDLEGLIINDVCLQGLDTLISAKRLFPVANSPFVKKRLRGSGGYRIYYLVSIKQKKVCLAFVHPKTGSSGASNITDESKTKFYKDSVESLKDGSKYRIKVNRIQQVMEFILEGS